MKYDLHVHSNVSDGKMSRSQIVTMAERENVQLLSFTEHNDFQIYENNKNVTLINGIEFDVKFNVSFHLLCYFPVFNNKIEYLIKKYRDNTNDSSCALIDKINRIYKMNINIEDIMLFLGKKYVTKRDIIDWLIYNQYASCVSEAANKYTCKKAISYVPKYSLNFKEVVDLIKESGGYTILAHPSTLTKNDIQLEEFLIQLIKVGLDGIEVINTDKITVDETKYYKDLAIKYSLLTSGGSDFHDATKNRLGIEGNESDVLIKLLKR